MNEIFHEKESVTKPFVSLYERFGRFWVGSPWAFLNRSFGIEGSSGFAERVCEAGKLTEVKAEEP
jgi:hypothetical protein